MPRLALLLKASANRVYGASAFALAAAELAVLEGALGRCRDGNGPARAGRRRLPRGRRGCAPGARPRSPSSRTCRRCMPLFEVEGDLLRPLRVAPHLVLDEDVTTIQRYSGKTNEAFTHLLVNVALAESGRFPALLAGERVTLLDPACGRGTSLNRAVVYGMDAHGIEIDQRDVEAYTQFILTWLKDKRLKHQLEQAKLRKGRETPAHRITVTYGREQGPQLAPSGRHRPRRHPRAHGPTSRPVRSTCSCATSPTACSTDRSPVRSRAAAASSGARRVCSAEALPVWLELLRPGGAMALAWNRHTLARADAGRARDRGRARAAAASRRRCVRAPRRPGDPPRRARGRSADLSAACPVRSAAVRRGPSRSYALRHTEGDSRGHRRRT